MVARMAMIGRSNDDHGSMAARLVGQLGSGRGVFGGEPGACFIKLSRVCLQCCSRFSSPMEHDPRLTSLARSFSNTTLCIEKYDSPLWLRGEQWPNYSQKAFHVLVCPCEHNSNVHSPSKMFECFVPNT